MQQATYERAGNASARLRYSPASSGPAPLTGRDMLCFSHDWSGDPLSKTHLMRLLARQNRILWVNSIGYRAPTASRADFGRLFRKLAAAFSPIVEAEPNVFVLNPLAIPAYGLPWVRALNGWGLSFMIKWAMRRLKFRRPINWVFNPAAALIAGRLGEERIIYYCVDEYTAFSGVVGKSLAEMERELCRKADAVFVSAERLYRSKRDYNPRTFLIRHGVDYDHFKKALDPGVRVPGDLASLPRPIIGYFGLISEDWFDLPLVREIARKFDQGSVVLLGKVRMDVSRLQELPNVHFLGHKPYAALPAYCKGFDVALVPFPISEVTLNANPLKAREYLAAGLPVVSTRIPEVEALEQCRIGDEPATFIRQIEESLSNPGPSAERSAAMCQESWAGRLEQLRTHLASVGGF